MLIFYLKVIYSHYSKKKKELFIRIVLVLKWIVSNFAGSVTSEKNGAGGQKFENIIVSVGYLSVKASSRQPPQVKVSEGRVVLSNQNQIKSNQIGEKKGI